MNARPPDPGPVRPPVIDEEDPRITRNRMAEVEFRRATLRMHRMTVLSEARLAAATERYEERRDGPAD